MIAAVFTSNQPRHHALIVELAARFDRVYAVMECTTVFPGQVADFFRKSPVMQDYFARVMAAEKTVFGQVNFLPDNVKVLPVRMGDLNMVDLAVLEPALAADVHVVFGATYIKGPLIDRLVGAGALNIHMGTSPFYRGSSCNFWAMYDGRPDYVGATIHRLSKGLDSGAMLFHVFPADPAADAFVYGMLSVRAAHRALVDALVAGRINALEPVAQDRALELRYTRNADFTDEVAAEYLARMPTAADMARRLAERDPGQFLRPVFR